MLTSFVVIMVVLFFCIYSIELLSPPKPADEGAPDSAFSARRAFAHVKVIGRKPHPTGTKEHERVRNYLVNEARKLGLETEVQSTTSFIEWWGIRAARVHNIIATLKGSGSAGTVSKAVLIAAHYDSQPHTPGAADDGAAAAAMLEAARALKHSPPLKNDIIFLFTDGEEVGLLGAKAFVQEHPLKDRIGVVLNLEARGNSGASVTFEISPGNGWLMQEYAKAVPYPFAASVMYEVYKLMPNNTDFTAFRRAGLSGFNAAFIDGFVNYHSMTDTPQNLDLGSLQHHGSYILSIARHFGNLPLDHTKAEDVTFFNPIGHWLVLYPNWLNLPLVVLVLLLYGAYVFVGIKKQRLSLKGITGGFILFLVTLAAAGGIAWLVQSLTKSLYPHYAHYYAYNYYNAPTYFGAFIALTLAIFSGIYSFLFSRLKAANLFAGFLATALLLMVFLFLYMETGAYMMIVPLMLSLIAGLICFLFHLSEKRFPTLFFLVQSAAVLPIIWLFAPMVLLLFVVFSLNFVLPGVILLVLLLGFLLPQLKIANYSGKWALPVLCLLIAVFLYWNGGADSGYDNTQPMQSNIMYCLDADATPQNALWVSRYPEPDEWNRQFFPDPRHEPLKEIYPGEIRKKPVLKNAAPLAVVEVPRLTILEDVSEKGLRQLHFNITSSREATIMELILDKKAEISSLVLDGKAVENTKIFAPGKFDYFPVTYHGVPGEGIDVKLECRENHLVEVIVVEKKFGLPEFPGIEPMPPSIIPDTDYESYLTLVKKRFVL